MTKEHYGTSAVPLTPAVRAGDFVYISGQVPVSDGQVVAGGIAEQTAQVMENIKATLALAGCDMSDVIKTHAYLKDAKDFGGFNDVYGRYFPENPPARTTAQAFLMIDILVEVEAIAYKPL